MQTVSVLEIGKMEHSLKVKNPFIACMHHLDRFPAGNGRQAPAQYLETWQKGNDFNPRAPWRMYHGERVPGFPVHPHRGFETVTVVLQGTIDHTDGMGGAGRYRDGDVQWMTAGAGLQHAEMFPLVHTDRENPLHLFQVWLNLPRQDKFVEPYYRMLWNEQIPICTHTDAHNRRTAVRVVAGEYAGRQAPPPNPNSWAARPENHVSIWQMQMEPGACFVLPKRTSTLGRMLYFYDGESLTIDGVPLTGGHYAELDGDAAIELKNGAQPAGLFLLEGEPIREPVYTYGPFVMNTREEVQQAFADYRKTQFGGWPWEQDDPVHPPETGRFARYADGSMHFPPQDTPQE